MNRPSNAGRPRKRRSGSSARRWRQARADAPPAAGPRSRPDDPLAAPSGHGGAPPGREPGDRREGPRRRRRSRRGGRPPAERRAGAGGGLLPGEGIPVLPDRNGLPVLVDSHAHLADPVFDRDRQEVVERAIAEGVHYILSMGSTLESSCKTVEIAESYMGVYAAVGVHPHDVREVDNKTLPALAELAAHPKVVAVGETGLDYYRDNSPRRLQRHWFREQIRLAIKVGKPVVVHCRDAGEDVYEVLNEERVWRVGGVVHCFTGDADLARRLLDLDLYLGAGGAITFRDAGPLREVFERVPLERIFVETDSPYLAPPPHRGRRNEPAYVVRVAEQLAELHGLSLEEVMRATSANVRRLFGMGTERRGGTIAYSIGRKLYLNITNRCHNACFFCGLLSDLVYRGYELSLEEEPGAREILERVGDPAAHEEIVFSGFGEPTLRLDVLKDVAGELRRRGARRLRLVTNGLGSRVHERDIVPELHGLFDAVSVSLQAPSAEAYAKVCQTKEIENPYPSVKEFVRAAKLYFPEVETTAVEMPGLIDIEACERVAREELGVPFRRRAFVAMD